MLVAIALALGIYFLAHGCSKKASAEAATLPTAGNADASATYDLVISGGRVMDPESKLDAVRNVGVRDGKIAAISTTSLSGKTIIDAKGLVVAPGFIDLHEHGAEPRNYQFQAHDGVTTSLELEVGTDDVAKWYAAREGKALINYGVSIGHIPVRMAVMHDTASWIPTADAARRVATPEDMKQMLALMDRGFREGALAEGMGINYTPAATHQEIIEMFRVAAKNNAPVHVHMRYSGMKEPTTGLAALEEVIAVAGGNGRVTARRSHHQHGIEGNARCNCND